MHPRLVGPLALHLALWLAACGGPVTEEDLQLWTNNDAGFDRITEIVSDPNQPLPTRVRALEVVVEKGIPIKLRTMMDEIKIGRDEVTAALVKELVIHVEKNDGHAAASKDALILIERYVTPEAFEPIRITLAKWAFAGVDWNSDEETVKKVGERISSGQIRDLGEHGVEGAAILLSYGFLLDKMIDLVADQKKLDAQRAAWLLEAMRRLHKRVGAEPYHVGVLARYPTPEAAAYLYEMYFTETYDEELRAVAFDGADEMLKRPRVRKEMGKLRKWLLKLMEQKDPEDRWSGAIQLVQLEGASQLEAILARLKDDNVYTKGRTEATRSVVDFCLDIHDFGHSAKAIPVFLRHLDDPNRIVQSVSIICLKANRALQAREPLRALAAKWVVPKRSREPPPEPIKIGDVFGDELTIDRLARNAAESLDLIAGYQAEHAAKKLNDTELKHKALIAIFEFSRVGEELAPVLAERYAAWHEQYKKDPAKYEKKKGPGAKPAPTDAKAPAPAARSAAAPAPAPAAKPAAAPAAQP